MEMMEEETRWREETELRLKELSESAKVKCQEAETLKLQLNNTSQALEEARKVEGDLREELAAQQRRQRAEATGLEGRIELERRSHMDELAEFKEQIRQHSRTIVALEERLLNIAKQHQAAEEERGVLSSRLREAKKKLEEWERNSTVRQPVQASPPPVVGQSQPRHMSRNRPAPCSRRN
ncbi:forkhead-associated domain-containing protein 1-like [Scyliorhinus canicula]|uniref:forkhead-associated domain-containing protein 1-like n=1 Tax=Scyliorhinus canicula TaxID=7830 RepID=UPI0018F614A7|nr:forkhead-associated domain-containing protein 1-like [Scyliorhinus canicula]